MQGAGFGLLVGAGLRPAWTDECVRPYAILPLALECSL